MLFTSIEFMVFLPVVFALYWVLRRQVRWQNLLVVAASYVFYGWWDWRFLLLIAFTTSCSYASGLMIRPEGSRRRNLAVMWTNIGLNLGILGLFKYYDFFASELARMLGCSGDSVMLNLILPVGISFYTFQALSYSIDVYRGKIAPTKDAVAFFAYVSFFPQLVAGPIERATNLLPQFLRERKFDYAMAVDGVRQMLWGFFKKVVVADNCAVFVDKVWGDIGAYGSLDLAVAAALFSIQIYCDFSGYSDIAIGCAKLFGIKLMRNSTYPTSVVTLPSSGAVGTSASPPGSATTYTSPSGVAVWRSGRWCATRLSSSLSADSGMEPTGPSWPGVLSTPAFSCPSS